MTISSVNNGSPYLRDEAKIAQFGVRVAAQVWDEVTLPTNLKSKGQNFLQNQKTALVQYQVDAVDLAPLKLTIDSFKCGWWYETYNPLMGIDEALRVVGLSINLNDPTASTLSIGDKILSQEQYNKTLKQQAQSAQQLKSSFVQQSKKLGTIQFALSETERNLGDLKESVTTGGSEVQNQLTTIIENLQELVVEINEKVNTTDFELFFQEQTAKNTDFEKRISDIENKLGGDNTDGKRN